MRTKFTVATLKTALKNEDYIYEYTSHIADKLRAIYGLFGWVHMLKTFEEAQNTIDQLMNYVYKGLLEGKEEVTVQTAGLMIEGWIDEDGKINIDYYFNLA